MEATILETKATKLYNGCMHGECPIPLDSTSACPVIDYCQKPCMDVEMADWLFWLKNEEKSIHAMYGIDTRQR